MAKILAVISGHKRDFIGIIYGWRGQRAQFSEENEKNECELLSNKILKVIRANVFLTFHLKTLKLNRVALLMKHVAFFSVLTGNEAGLYASLLVNLIGQS